MEILYGSVIRKRILTQDMSEIINGSSNND